ncbi:MAG: 6-phosphogluconolactonase [Pararhodobacter sp.]|nr:6-phosphogluconolactonase [Pararhodobacter sp.]
MEFHEYADFEMMALAVAQRLGADLRRALTRRERALFCVPGGTTPGPVFDTLAQLELEWERIDIVPSDERWVPLAHARSNAGLLHRRLLQGPAAAAGFIALDGGAATAPDSPPDEDVIARLTERLAPALPIDVALLGMGEDGHVASLFPGAPELIAALADDAPPLMAITAPGQPEPRVSLTAPVLRQAFVIHILITGEAKRRIIEDAEGQDPLDAPVAALLDEAQVHWTA